MLEYRKWIKRIGAILASVLVITSFIPQTVSAIWPLEVGEDVSLKVDYQGAESPVAGAEFKVYKVAEVDRFAEFTLTEDFEKYPVSLNDLDSSGWKILAETLATYVAKDQITPVDSGVTNQKGEVHFPSDGIEMTTGLYLVLGEQYLFENKFYYPEPVLVCLPNRDADDEWVYDVTIETKYTTEVETTELEVIKIWKNDNVKTRPEDIEIELLQDGNVYDTVKLSKGNDWCHKWSDLEAGHDWKVVEKKVPNGYTVTVERNGATYAVTNTYKNTPPSGDKNLPQTGMLWWPVPILAGTGMVFFMIGWAKRKKSEK